MDKRAIGTQTIRPKVPYVDIILRILNMLFHLLPVVIITHAHTTQLKYSSYTDV